MTDRPEPTGGWTLRLTDIDQLAALFLNWQGRIEQISGGQFEADLKLVRGRVVRAVSIRANQRARIRGRDSAGLFWAHAVSAGSAESLWQGHRLAVGQMVLTGPENDTDYTSPRLTSHQSIALLPAEMDAAVRSLLASDGGGLPRGWAAVAPSPAAGAQSQRLFARFVEFGLSSPHLMATPDAHRLEQECVRGVVAALSAPAASRPRLPLSGRARLVRQAEEYMRGRLADPVGAIDLCRAFRVSDRTLRLAFREHYGMGPMGYFKYLRLNAVHTALKGERVLQVRDAAVAYGFHHLGNFAADYRRLFGVSPSGTVR